MRYLFWCLVLVLCSRCNPEAMTAQAFIKKYGTDGLLEAIGNRKTGQIARGNDWANVAELLELLK